jgi:large subunit ribosomal protein L1
MLQGGKRYRKDLEKRPKHVLSVDLAVKALKGFTKTKFDQTVDIAFNLGIDPKQADQLVRGSVSLPKGIGVSKKVIAFCPETEIEKAKAAGAIEAGADELIDRVSKGWSDFDVAIAHPSLMGKVGKLGKVLGPQGKMPSPKAGTVTDDVTAAVKAYKGGKVEYRVDAGANVHGPVGKASFAGDKLAENVRAFVESVRAAKPHTSKGTYIRRVTISSTMGPGVQLDMA